VDAVAASPQILRAGRQSVSHGARVSTTRRMSLPVALATIVLAAGCTVVGPDYRRPDAPVPAAFARAAGWKTAVPADALPRGAWWRIYRDPVLDDLAARANAGNQNLRLAEARLRQARAITAQARAGLSPVVTADGGVTRAGAGSSSGVMTYSAQAELRWEADLWGRIRRTVEAAEADLEASSADVEAARLSMHAALVQNYFALRTADALIDLLAETVAAFQRSVELTTNRYEAGVAAKVDIVQAEVQRDAARAQLIDAGIDRARFEHAIALLMGVPPSAVSIAPDPASVTLPTVPVELTSALLERRPDIAAQERAVAAANARIGIAEAAFFPDLAIGASAGRRSTAIGDLLSAPARVWSIGASLAQLLFDGGARNAVTEQALAVHDAEVAIYRQVVLAAIVEVEDQIVTLRTLDEEIAVQDEVVRNARQAEALVTNQYRAGVVSFLNVLNAQTTALAAERTRLNLMGRRFTAHVLLIRALGGGWDVSALRAAPPGEAPGAAPR